MKQIFILGRNPTLSREEIFAFLKSRNQEFKEILFRDNYLILELSSLLKIQGLGGTIRAGEVVFAGNTPNFKNFLKINEVIPSDKFSYTIFGDGNSEILKEKFKQERKKAVLKQGRKNLRIQEGDPIKISGSEYNLFLYNHNENIFFGELNEEYDYTELKKRDMEKPFRREELAISPRLAKILINLSGAKEGEILLDPFCGVGAILLEGLSKNMNVIGIDKDRGAIENALKNVEWLSKNYLIKRKYTLLNQDSGKINNLNFNAVATETPLGELLKKKPSNEEAKKAIETFERRIIPVLKRISQIKKKEVKIAVTFPIIRSFKPDEKQIAEECNLKIAVNPIIEFRPDQYISREILVFC
ncbi:MAG: DNA methyltransferase [Candidatus Pacearchaeota archaeon]